MGVINNIVTGKFALLLIESNNSIWQGHLRSRAAGIEVDKLAEKIGHIKKHSCEGLSGGGHKRSAGFKIKGRRDKIIELIGTLAKQFGSDSI